MEYGLIGERLGHSFSPLIHREFADYEYKLRPLPKEEVLQFMDDRCFKGLNVTIPYKKLVMRYCDELDETARKIGSVNTLVVGQDGRMTGYNTDLDGILYSVRRSGIGFAGKKVLILGSGGTSLTAKAAAETLGAAEILIVSRTGPVNYGNLDEHANADIVVNTTPVGMYPKNGEQVVDLTRFRKLSGVVDVVYNPLRTALRMQAESLGIPSAGGLPMLVAQAKSAAEKFTGHPIDDGEIERVIAKLASQVSNVVIIGMPGSGKSSIGEAVAARTGLKFVDADAEIEREAGRSIPEIFERFGEAAFRDLESRVLARLGAVGGQVIATGGGAVLREANYAPLHQNGRIYLIHRARALLATGGRPLSKSPEALEQMEQVRAPLYQRFADTEIRNDGTIDDAAKRITEDFYETAGH